jgi:hypothetical protein
VLTKAASAVRHCVVIPGIQKRVLKPVENVQVQVIQILKNLKLQLFTLRQVPICEKRLARGIYG